MVRVHIQVVLDSEEELVIQDETGACTLPFHRNLLLFVLCLHLLVNLNLSVVMEYVTVHFCPNLSSLVYIAVAMAAVA